MLDPNLREFQSFGAGAGTFHLEAADASQCRSGKSQADFPRAERFSRVRREPGTCRLHAGRLPLEMLQAMSLRPEILKAFGETGQGVYPGGILERPLKEKVILKASLQNECQFCINTHRTVMRMIGIPDPQIEDLEAPEHLSRREALALDYTALAIQDANRIEEDFFDRLREEFASGFG